MSREEIKKRIRMIRNIHYLIIVLFFLAVYLIIFAPTIGIYGAVAILSMGTAQAFNRGGCPLTVEEHKALRHTGETVHDHGFIEGFFKDNFNIEMPTIVINTILAASYVISAIAMYNHLANIFSNIP